jgi:hypothetical protein
MSKYIQMASDSLARQRQKNLIPEPMIYYPRHLKNQSNLMVRILKI